MYHPFEGIKNEIATLKTDNFLLPPKRRCPWIPGLNDAIISDPIFPFVFLPPNKTTWSVKLTTPYEFIAISKGYGSRVDHEVPLKTSVITFEGFFSSSRVST